MNDNNKKSLKEMWKDPQKKALIKLGLWLAFFLITFLFLWIASLFSKNDNPKNLEQTNKQEEKVEANVPRMLEKLINSNYSYEIKITGDNISKLLSGTVNNNITSGYLESNGNIIKYSYHDEKYYQIIQSEEVETNEIFSDEEKSNINLNNILLEIKNYEMNNESKLEENAYIYEIDEKHSIKIIVNENNINSINILNNNISYEMEFNLIL